MAREIKVFCPEHQAAFEVEAKPQLVCEIREHSLSVDFPHAEFWQYCCDCQTFSVNDFETNGSVKANCLHCERTTTRLFLCSNCKTVCYDSDEDTRGKITTVNFDTGISPSCPACASIPNGRLIQHSCYQINAPLLTDRNDCPFCRKPTETKVNEPATNETITEKPAGVLCPNCNFLCELDATFCTECGYKFAKPTYSEPFKTLPQIEIVNQTEIYCPKCNASNPPDSEFCGDCRATLSVKKTVASPSFVKPVIYAGGGIGVFVVFIFIVLAINSNKSTYPATNTNSNTRIKPSTSTTSKTTSTASNTSSSNNEESSIERTYQGTIRGKILYMSLTRDGNNLSGTVSTARQDTVSGTIDESGQFRMKGYENGNRFTGVYSGRIYSDGSIEGSWTTPEGTKKTSFSLTEQ